MKVRSFDVVVIGAGPAGIAAATSAAECGARTALIDENASPGGQIWRRGVHPGGDAARGRWLARLRRAGCSLLVRSKVVAQPEERMLLVETSQGAGLVRYTRLVLAPGARELFLPFPGWTLPGVAGAGGLQALVKGGLPIAGARVLVAGSGPLLLAAAAHLRQAGAQVVGIVEQAPARHVLPVAARLPTAPGKLAQAATLAWALRGVPFHANAWVTEALGDARLEAVRVHRGGAVEVVHCEYLACGFGLLPNLHVSGLVGCTISEGAVRVDDRQHTSVDGVYCAGEATGIGGLDVALLEGRIAGYSAADRLEEAQCLFPALANARRFASVLAAGFVLRPELRSLASDDTVLCRCEDVTYGEVRRYPDWRSAKLQTRCGMGACQGRICGGATGFLFGWADDSYRPPAGTARIGSLARMQHLEEAE